MHYISGAYTMLLKPHLQKHKYKILPFLLIGSIVGLTTLLSITGWVRSRVNGFGSTKTSYIYNFASTSTVAALLLVAIISGFLLYAWMDYRQHKMPLVAVAPSIRYSYWHHLHMVILPLLRHKWKPLTYGSVLATASLTAAVTTTVVISLYTHASPTLITTLPASGITDNMATLNGYVEATIDTHLTNQGFEYGTTASYGQISDAAVDSTQILDTTWGPYANSNGSGDGQTASPTGTAVDSSGNVFILDSGNGRVQKFSNSGTFLSQFPVGHANDLIAIAVDSHDNVFITLGTAHIVLGFDISGTQILQIGTEDSSGFGAGSYQFEQLTGIAVDSHDNIFVTDYLSNLVKKYNPGGTLLASTGSGTHPKSVAIDPSDNVYCLGEDFILKLDNNLVGITSNSIAGHITESTSLAIDKTGTLFVSYSGNQHRIYQVTSSFEQIYQYPIGINDLADPTAASLSVDAQGNLYVSDTTHGKVFRFVRPNPDGNFSQSQYGLLPNTTYHYRAYVTDLNSTFYGNDLTFTTAELPSNFRVDGTVGSNKIVLKWSDNTARTAQYQYKEHSSSTWLSGDSNHPNVQSLYSGKAVIWQLTPSTAYDFRLAYFDFDGNQTSSWSNLAVTTPAKQTIHITDCEGLQGMAINRTTFVLGDTTADYYLDNDIDCSDTRNWTWSPPLPSPGATNPGFFGIQDINSAANGFSGTFDGQGHTISNLYSAGSMLWPGGTGLFSQVSFGTVKNVHLQAAAIQGGEFFLGENHTSDQTRGNGLLIGKSYFGTINNVSAAGDLSYSSQPRPSGPPYSQYNGHSLATDNAGNSYVLDGLTIRKLDATGALVLMWDLVPESGREFSPNNIAVDGTNVYVSGEFTQDGTNSEISRIQHYDTDGNYLDAFGSEGSNVGELFFPTGIAARNGKVYVVDYNNGRMERFDSDGSNPIAWAANMPTAYNPRLDTYNCSCLTVDSAGHVFLLDDVNYQVQRFDSDGSNPITFGTGSGSSLGSFRSLDAIGVDTAGHVYVSDLLSAQLQRFDSDGSNPTLWGSWGNAAGQITDVAGIALGPDGGLTLFERYRGSVTTLDQNGTVLHKWASGSDNNSPISTGGLVGNASYTSISQASAQAVISINGTPYNNMYFGGLVGGAMGTSIVNTYAGGSISVSNGGLVIAGGLVGLDLGYGDYFDRPSQIKNSYSTGSISVHDGARLADGGGFAGVLLNIDTQNNFTTSSVTGTVLTPTDYPNYRNLTPSSGGFSGFMLNVDTGSGPIPFTNNYYDRARSTQTNCVGYFTTSAPTNFGFSTPETPPGGSCTQVNANGSQSDFFKNTAAVTPLTQWDFSGSIWHKRFNSYPILNSYTPGPPDNLAGTPSTTSVALNWQAPQDDGGSPIVNYLVQYRAHGTNSWQEFSHTASAQTAYTIPGLTSGTTYDFQVSALNSVGQSGWVLGIYDVKTDPVTPATPTTPTPRTPRTPTTPTTTPTPKDAESPPVTSVTPGTAIVGRFAGSPISPVAQVTSTWLHTAANVLPYLLILILLLLALLYARQARREYLQRQSLLKLLARYQNTKQATDAYIAITTHYLATPLAIMKGAIELLASLRKLPEWSVASLQQNLAKLDSTITELAAFQVADMQVPGILPATVGSGSSPRVNPLRVKKIWSALLGVALGLVALDVGFVITGAFTKPLVRLGVQALCFVLAGGLLVVAYHFRDAQVAFRQATTRLVTGEQRLLEQRQSFISSAATKLSDHYENLRTLTQSYGFIPETKNFFNGLRILGGVAASLTRVERFASMSRDVPSVNISGAYTALLPRLNAIASEHKVSLVNKLESVTIVQAQHEELDQLLFSIVDNGINFNAEGGTVTIAAQKLKNTVAITIRDTGGGIPAEKLEHLLEPFARATSTETFDHEGLGLSMYTNKIIVEKLGGSMDIRSGKDGTTVRLELPSAAQRATVPVLVVPQTVNNSTAFVGSI